MDGIIAQVDGAPRVEIYRGGVAVWTAGDDTQVGLILQPDAAVQTAVRMLGAVDEIMGERAPVVPVEGITLEGVTLDDRERVARLVVTALGKRIPLYLDLTQLAELAAATRVLSVEADR